MEEGTSLAISQRPPCTCIRKRSIISAMASLQIAHTVVLTAYVVFMKPAVHRVTSAVLCPLYCTLQAFKRTIE